MKKLILIVLIVVSCIDTSKKLNEKSISINYDITPAEWESMSDSLKSEWMVNYVYNSNDMDLITMPKYAKEEIRRIFDGEYQGYTITFLDDPTPKDSFLIYPYLNQIQVTGRVKGPNKQGGTSIKEYLVQYKITPYHREVSHVSLKDQYTENLDMKIKELEAKLKSLDN